MIHYLKLYRTFIPKYRSNNAYCVGLQATRNIKLLQGQMKCDGPKCCTKFTSRSTIFPFGMTKKKGMYFGSRKHD